MRMIGFRAMVAAIIIIAVISATGLSSAQIRPIQPTQPPEVEPPQPPTPTPTPTQTIRPPRPTIAEPPVIQPPIVETPPPTTQTAEPTQTQAPTATPTPTLTQTQPPTAAPTQTQPPTVTPPQLPVVTPPQSPMVAPPQVPAPTVIPLQSPVVQPVQNESGSAGIQVSSGPADKLYPAISGESIVWIANDSMNGSPSVQLYNMPPGNASTISDAASVPLVMPYQLAIADNNAAWSGMSQQTGAAGIHLYDTDSGTLQLLTGDSPGTQMYPGVSQDYIIWTNHTDESDDAYLYETAGGDIMPVLTDPYYQTETDIGGSIMVWADNETAGGDFDIVAASPGEPEGRFLGDSGEDRYPDVSSDGGYVAWINYFENRSAVYLYDTASDNITRITGDAALPDAVAVDGDLVVYSDLRSGNHDIYVYDISNGIETPVTRDSYDQSYPDVSNGEIVWMGDNTGQWEIYHASAGELQNQSGITVSPTPVPQTQAVKSIGAAATATDSDGIDALVTAGNWLDIGMQIQDWFLHGIR